MEAPKHEDGPSVVVLFDHMQTAVDALRFEVMKDKFPPLHPLRRKRWWHPILRHLLLITLVWQALCIGILTIIDETAGKKAHEIDKNAFFKASVALMIVFQVSHLAVIITASIKLTKQIAHRTVSVWFLAQSYLSTILLFGGLYTLIFRLKADSWAGVSLEGLDETDSLYILLAFVRLLFFSIVTMTSTGYGSIHPTRTYNYILVSVQMLCAVLYTTSIFAKGLSVLAVPRQLARRDRAGSREESSA